MKLRSYFFIVLGILLCGSFSMANPLVYRMTPQAFLNFNIFDQKIIDQDPVVYFGGPIIPQVNIKVVYWGQGADADLQTKLNSFYKAIVSSDYIDQLSEYSTPTQKVTRGSVSQIITIQPKNSSKRLTQKDIENELEAQVDSGALSKPDENSLYMLHFPDGYRISISFGLSCFTWAADHEVYNSKKYGPIYYAMMPCNSTHLHGFDNLTVAASHELAEAISDPACPLANEAVKAPAAWLTASASEIGDICNNDSSTLKTVAGDFIVQSVWLNSKKSCNNTVFTSH